MINGVTYDINSVLSVLFNKQKINELRFYKGNTDATNIIVDVERIVRQASLTDKQLAVLDLYWVENLSQEQVAVELGISQQMVVKYCKTIKKKLEIVVEKWLLLERRGQDGTSAESEEKEEE